ncbi:transglycosylase SLT domain-containing protein [Candidatus Schmidhempelia bombi]|uniref:LysM peptidoglycan-binding domain-containing protein n=1 Tax=Candidatus Schmidhempelia bombi str. Bimp TaxID=1387197 RepID=A0AB94IEY0_9GAMM|nr:transglycosylase SLT domain-containing protein [Candidatus Schmidhempelia bombi]TEA28068.1 LysM peptidoglycan-binding domain-containing protein [Candidatus Schmidhempelia bombi str. Bimp]
MKKFVILMIIPSLIGCQNLSRAPKAHNKAFHIHKVTYLDSLKINPWQYIQKTQLVDIPDNARIINERNKLVKNKRSFENLLERSEPYIHYFITQLQLRKMPIELLLIPLIESACNPLAISYSKAAGLWQIAPITARNYGLVFNSWYDGRLDLIASTDIALNHLQYLNKNFDGDWLLTLAAYNAGEGRISKAIQSNIEHHLPTNYWALQLSKETMQYVPKFLAMIDIIRHNERYDILLPTTNFDNTLIKINLGKAASLDTISKYSHIPYKDLITYNAAYLDKKLNGPYHLLVPRKKLNVLHQKLLKNNYTQVKIVDLTSDLNNKRTHIVPSLLKTNRKYSTITDKDLQFYTRSHLKYKKINYMIKSGDSLSTIAKAHRVTTKELMDWNNIKNANSLKIGSKLIIHIK